MGRLPWKHIILGVSLFIFAGLLSNSLLYQASFAPEPVVSSNIADSKQTPLDLNSHLNQQNSDPNAHIDAETPQRQVLPKNVKPLNYKLTLEPNFETFEFDGDVAITLDVLETSSSISLNILEIKIEHAALTVDGSDPIEPVSTEENEDDNTVTFKFDSEFKAGSKAVLSLKYVGILNDKLAGFYRSKYIEDGKTKYLATTQMEPADARRAFPSFDEPGLKATYDITLIHSKEHTALSNMDVKHSKTNENGKVSTTFNTTPLMSSYLVAFIVGELTFVESNLFRVPVRVYCTPGLEKKAQFSADIGARTLKLYEKLFDIPYPLPKMDMVGIHDFSAGAMENWGLVTYRIVDLLFDEKNDGAATKQRVAEVVMHELAHQWFGNLVTMDWWNELYLNESFADYISKLAMSKFYPEWKVWESYVSDTLQASLSLDSLRSSHPIQVPVNRADEINQIFDAISYSKGSSILRMVSNYLGEEDFLLGVSNYLKKHMYSNAKGEALWASLDKASGKDVSGLVKVWITKIGYPVLSVKEDGDKISVEQHRFLSTGDVKPADDTTIYPLNLAIRTKKGIDDSIILKERNGTFTVEDTEFFKLNANQAGLYRVKYTPERVAKLAQSAELLSSEDRIGLVADTRALATSGYSKTSAFLELINTWKVSENEPSVWAEVLASFGGVKRVWVNQPKGIKDGLNKFSAALVEKKAHEVGWDIKPDDSVLLQQLKADLYSAAVASKIPLFVDDALAKFKKYSEGDESAINPNLRTAVFYAAGLHGGKDAFDKLLKIYQEKSSVEGLSALRSLGYSPDADLRAKALSYSVSGIVRTQDVSYLLAPFASTPESIKQLWGWFKSEWKDITKIYPASLGLLARVVGSASAGFTTQAELDDFNKFFADKNTKTYDQTLGNTRDRVTSYINWLKNDSKDVEKWLSDHNYL